MKLAFSVFLMAAVMISSCSSGSPNRIKIIGGEIRLVSFETNRDGILEVSEFSENDKTVGIAIALEWETFKDNVPNDQIYENGNFGPINKIEEVSLFLKDDSLEIMNLTSLFYNDSSMNRMLFSHNFMKPYIGYKRNSTNEYFEPMLLENLEDFKKKYNDRSLFIPEIMMAEVRLEQEFFFWMNDTSIVNLLHGNSKISLEMEFEDEIVVIKQDRN